MSGLSGPGVIEVGDNEGSTVAYTGTATTTPADVPAVVGDPISQLLFAADDKNLEVSFDGGTTYFPFKKNEVLTWDLKGLETSIKVRTSSGTAEYRVLLNFEEC